MHEITWNPTKKKFVFENGYFKTSAMAIRLTGEFTLTM